MTGKLEEPVPLPSSLALVEKWANEAGKNTKRVMSDPLPDGSQIPLLVVTHGVYNVLIREQGSCVLVFAQAKIPDDVRKKLATLTADDKQRLLITLRGELSSNGRTGYSYVPQKFTSIDQLEGFSVEQLLKPSGNDVSSFNRFCDAIQEIVTVSGKAIAVFGLFAPTQSAPTTDVKPAPTSLYG